MSHKLAQAFLRQYTDTYFPKLGLYAEARIGGIVIVWASEPCPGLLWWVLKAYCAAAARQGMEELTIFYRARKIRDGVIAPMDLA